MKNLLCLFFFTTICSILSGQNSTTNNLYDSISNRIKVGFPYEKVEQIDCDNAGIRVIMLEFSINKNGYVKSLKVLNDSLSPYFLFFKTILDQPFLVKEKGKGYKGKIFIQPVFLSFPYCQKKIIASEKKESFSLSDKELRIEFQHQIMSISKSVIDLFGNGKNPRNIKNVLILPTLNLGRDFCSEGEK